MSFEIREMTVKSTDNIHTLVGRIYIPEGEARGVVHIVHGMTEHINRYDSFMAALAENGFVAFGYDNLGHGKTAKDDSELGFIAAKDGWKYLVNDVEGDIYTIQQFRNKNVLDPALEKVEVPNPHDLRKLAEQIKPLFDGVVKVKTGEFGEQIIE